MEKECDTCEGLGTVIVDVWTGWEFGAWKRETCDECFGHGVVEYAYEFNGEFFKTKEDVEEAVSKSRPDLGDDEFSDYMDAHVSSI